MRSFSVLASLSMAVRYQPMGVPAVRTLSRPIATMPRILLADQPAGTDDAAARKTGVVKWFNTQKGFGFITPADGTPDVFVHQTAIYAPGFRSLAEGESVEYEIETSSDGRIRALSVTGPNGDYVQGAPRDPFFGGN